MLTAARMLFPIQGLDAIYRLVVLSQDKGIFRFSSRSTALLVSGAQYSWIMFTRHSL